MANFTITAETGHFNLSPVLFKTYAEQYFACEASFAHAAKYSPVPYFLLCRSIELTLKARHLEHKSRDVVRREYGHNLKKAYDKLPAKERRLGPIEYEVLTQASAIYDIPNKGFEYVSVWNALTGFSEYPDLQMLRLVAKELLL